MSRPVKRARTQRFSRPLAQKAHSPQVQPSHGTPTRSALAGHDADDLVAEHDAAAGKRELAVEQVQVGAADAAGAHLQQQLARAGLRHVALDGPQRAPGRVEHHRPRSA